MARPLRLEFSGALYHIMSRGNAKAPIFIDDADRIKFIDILAKTVQDYRWTCHAYCLMGNHYHLLIETPDITLSAGMHLLNGMYTQAFNHRHHRTGHVFEGRFRSILVEKESYLLELTRYIVLNPVRSGLTTNPADYRWSSYNATCGAVEPPGFLQTDWILEQFGNVRSSAISAYTEFINDSSCIPASFIVDDRQPFLGSESFIDDMKSKMESAFPRREPSKPQHAEERQEIGELFGSKSLSRKERNMKVMIAFFKLGYSKKEIAEATGLHLSSIGRIIGRADASDARPDPSVHLR
ncbi:MAG: addiction module toxin RelE [Chlorobiaceae bacterium]|nr:addiction module toxin RelE [Chlorobiaceae bacterium]NTV24770.1 addiction module toxin RelE [Chlorobiaceae bacterium]